MIGSTHTAGGMLAGTAVGLAFGQPWVGLLAGAVGGLLPDIDTPGSTIGRKVPVLPLLLNALLGHRGGTHTVWFCLALPVLGAIAAVSVGVGYTAWLPVALAFLAGELSHLALDALTRSGVQPFWPLPLRLHGPLTTGDFISEGAVSLLCLLIAFNLLF